MPQREPIGLFVARTAKSLSRAFETALAEHGGSLPGWLVVASLATNAHGSQRSIAADIGVEGPTLTHHLNRMESAGLVTRTRDPQNRRVHQVALSDAGRAEFEQMLTVVGDFDRRLRAGFSEDELDTLRHLLGRLAANADASPATPAPERTSS